MGSILIALLMIAGLFAIFGINPFSPLKKLKGWRPKAPKRKQKAGDFIRALEGKKRENLVQKSLRETKNSLIIIGQAERYKRTVIFSVVVGLAAGFISFLIFRSPLVTLVLALGCGLLPLWFTNLSVYSYTQNVNSELETMLSLVTTAYTRHNDLVKAISESLSQANQPVKQIFERFVLTVNNYDPDIESAIVQMKTELDNALFQQWCDTLILCQSDHTLKAGLQPIVAKLSELKKQQSENETLMLMPLRDIILMVGITAGAVPILYILSPDWYYYLAHTIAGQIVLAIVAVIIFTSIHKAIKLSKPIDYRL